MKDPDDPEIPVLYHGERKYITGVTRRTTCDDVIYALVCGGDELLAEKVDVTEYEVWERWRGVERPLRGRTRILKLWRTWGSMSHHVTLFIKKVESRFDSSSEVSHSKRMHRRSGHRRDSSPEKHRSRQDRARERERKFKEKEREIQAEKRRKSRASSSSPTRHSQRVSEVPDPSDDRTKSYHKLVQSILEGEKVIQDQIQRIQDLDNQIDDYETKLHHLRVNRNGANYLQEAYMKDKSDESTSTSSSNDDYLLTEHTRNLEVYVEMCENVLQMQDRIEQEGGRIEELSQLVLEETLQESSFRENSATSGPFRKELRSSQSVNSGEDIAKLKQEYKKASELAEIQEYQLEVLDTTIRECDSQISSRRDYIHDLSASVEQGLHQATQPSRHKTTGPMIHTGVGLSHKAEVKGSERHINNTSNKQNGRQGVSQGGQLEPYLTYVTYFKRKEEPDCVPSSDKQPKPDDSNSDTGLSSMHSDESPTILETLV